MIKYVGSNRPIAVLKQLCKEVDSPHSLAIYLCLKSNDFDALATLMSIDPINYLNSRQYSGDSLVSSFLKKSSLIESSGIDDLTMALFYKNEEDCKKTNQRLREDIPSVFISRFLRAQTYISRILGDVPKLSSLDCEFGPGVTVGVSGVDTSFYAKYASYPCTTTLKAAKEADFLEDSTWFEYLKLGSRCPFEFVGYSKLSLVPKSFKIKRVIAAEPLLNSYIQKGIGQFLKKRLLISGIDLRRQEHNQELAKRALKEELSTVDFTSASDTISHGTVLNLLPIDWFEFLDKFRTNAMKSKEVIIPLQKFSSMGNGFTFELESLIFYVCALACRTDKTTPIGVFGDDVIIHKDDYESFKDFTSFLGFTVNLEKSFTTGRFFESCGCDYFDEVNVRAVYLKNDLLDDFDIYTAHNRLMDFQDRTGWSFPHTLSLLTQLVPRHRRCFVPPGYQGGFNTETSEHFIEDENGWEGVWSKCLTFKSDVKANTLFVPSLLHSISSPSNGFRPLRRSGMYRKVMTFFPKRDS